jgi:hypothetical protein
VTYEEWLELALADERIVGVVVTGSRGRGAMVHAGSDWDLRVVVRDGEEAFAESLGTRHGSGVGVSAATLGFRTSPEWDRYSFAHVTVAVDKLGGEVARARGRHGVAGGLTSALTGSAAAQQALFRAVEARIRARGLGAVVDDWHPHVDFLRG